LNFTNYSGCSQERFRIQEGLPHFWVSVSRYAAKG
jgi:hypothetical protein